VSKLRAVANSITMQEVLKKLRFKGEGIVIQAPNNLIGAFLENGCITEFHTTPSTNTLVFVSDQNELTHFLNDGLKHIVPDSVFWIAYPKGTSKLKSNINRDSIRMTAEEFGITTVSAISIDDTWSALRFRPINQVGK
jgi:hypothetical protein